MKDKLEESSIESQEEKEGLDIPISYDALTTCEEKSFDNENLLQKRTPIVFPELPAPFNHMYAKFRNLNADLPRMSEHEGISHFEERAPHTAVEVGLKWTF